MARRRKRRDASGPARAPESPPGRLARPFAEALRGFGEDAREEAPAARPAAPPKAAPAPGHPPKAGAAAPPAADPGAAAPPPGPAHAYEDRVAWNQAALGVRPLADRRAAGPGPRRRRPDPTVAAPADADGDAAARARLAALVAGGLRFRLDREEDGRVSGLRADADPGALRSLRGGRAHAEAEVDLHGLSGDEAEARVTAFLRGARGRGLRVVRIVTGKGLHSAHGLPVLRERVLHALTDGGAAPFVLALCSAASLGGGAGALLVRVARR